MYKTLVRPMLMYGCETWTLTQSDILQLSTCERKMLRKTYGPVQVKGEWQMRYNTELYQLYKLPDVTGAIKVARLQWAGHIHRMSDAKLPQRTMEGKLEGEVLDDPNYDGWMDGVAEDLRTLGIKSWWRVARDVSWKKALWEAEARIGL
jgi:hypothetical protein